MISLSVISSILYIYFCNFNLFIFESIPPNVQIKLLLLLLLLLL